MNRLEQYASCALGYPIDWAATGAWAQAIATTIAVFWAARLADRGVENRAELQRMEQLDSLLGLYEWLAELLASFQRKIINGRENFKPSQIEMEQLDQLERAISTASILQMPSREVTADWLLITRDLLWMRLLCRGIIDGNGKGGAEIHGLRAFDGRLQGAIGRLSDQVAGLRLKGSRKRKSAKA